MLRVESNSNIQGFTEFEEDILFDQDDPDFDAGVAALSTVPIMLTVRRNMSLASVRPAELHSNHSSLAHLSHSLDDITEASWSPQFHSDHLTIEELRLQMTSCFTCGVSWSHSHVSLDCSECGGYALERPCPECEGVCGAMWKRDLSMSHASSKARWEGKCCKGQQKPPKTAASSHELHLKFEKLSANS